MAASLLLCLRLMSVSPHLLFLMVQQRRRPVPHRTSTHIEGTQSPACNPLAIPEYSPRRPQRCSLTVADRPVPPDPVPILPTPNHLARGALFPFAYEVSCRVRAERVKPYASSRWRFTPRTPQKVRVGPPPPGATRELGVTAMLLLRIVYAHHARLSTLHCSEASPSTM